MKTAFLVGRKKGLLCKSGWMKEMVTTASEDIELPISFSNIFKAKQIPSLSIAFYWDYDTCS